MTQPADRMYSRTHEWALVAGDVATVGITQFAQEQLGDVVFVELPAIGAAVAPGMACGNIESVKAVSEVFSPVAGEVIEVNEELVPRSLHAAGNRHRQARRPRPASFANRRTICRCGTTRM